MKTWSETSIRMTPIHRTDPSLAILDDSNFLIFGGATEYLEELFLNDIWIFNIGYFLISP
jgi:hypothetical protein